MTTRYNEFKKTISENKLVLVDFWAPWCGPCRMIKPIIDELKKETNFCIEKVNVDKENQLAAEYNINSIPTILILKNGEVVERLIGAQSKAVYLKELNKHV